MSAVSLEGVLTVARGELRQRVRAGRWRWVLASWFILLLGFATLLRLALTTALQPDQRVGPPLFGGLMLMVLALALLVVPALTAQSVNGDRERGVLAPLQLTLLTAWDITLGKLAAAWGAALVFLAFALPLVGWAVVEGGLAFGHVVVTVGVVALLLGVLCAVSLALSALLARSTMSAVLSYLVVFAMTVGTLVAYALALVTTQTTVHRSEYSTTVTHSERVWWLLAPNPFVILADAAPRLATRRDPTTHQVVSEPLDPLGSIGQAVRDTRRSPNEQIAVYGAAPLASPATIASPQPFATPEAALPPPNVTYGSTLVRYPRGPGPVWPYGLGFDLLVAAAALWLTARRLRAPTRRLGRGVRVA